MKISKVEAFLVSCPLPEPLVLPFYGGVRTVLKRDAMYIRVVADNGLIGFAPGPAHERALLEIRETISPFLEGLDPKCWFSFGFKGDLELTKTYRAVEIAIMDLVARFNGCPLSDIAGGAKRDRIKLYGSAGMYMKPERFAEEALAITGMGFQAYKMRPARGPEEDLEAIQKMRSAVGADIGLMIDAHSWWRMGNKTYSPETILNLANAMAEFHPTWLEEPLPPENHEAYSKLKEKAQFPIATGEHEPNEEGFMDLFDKRCTDFIQMDVCCQGGFAMAKRIFEKVKEYELRFAFHSWGTNLEVLAAAHLGVCWEEDVVEWLEFPCYSSANSPGMYPFAAATEILKDPLEIEEGYLIMPDGPGLGITIDERIVEKYPFIQGPWSYFKIDNPPETVAVTGDHSIKWIEGV